MSVYDEVNRVRTQMGLTPLVSPDASLTASAKYDDIDFSIPESVQKAAQRGLDLHKELGRGGTDVGMATARTLVKGGNVSPEKARHIAKYFPRHANDNLDDKKSNGWVAWLLWGGDAGKSWSEKLVNQMDSRD